MAFLKNRKMGLWLGLALLALMLTIGAGSKGALAGAPFGTPGNANPASDNSNVSNTNPASALGAGGQALAKAPIAPDSSQISGVKASGPVTSSPYKVGKLTMASRPDAVLYDQYDNPGTNATSSQDFEAALNAYDDFTADDFTVPSGASWTVNEVDVPGVYFGGNPAPGGPAASFNVYFYSDASGLPGAQIGSALLSPYVNTTGNFVVTLSSPMNLGAGHYWVSVQARMDYGAPTAGQWGWSDRTVTSGSPAAWQNPGGGFGACPSWTARTVCVAGTTAEPDQMFRLQGTCTGNCPIPPTATNTPSPTNTPVCPSWTLVAPYPINVLDDAVAAVGTNVYAFAGVSNGALTSAANAYNSGTNTWSSIAAYAGGSTEWPAATSNGTNVYIMGGVSGGLTKNSLYQYSPGSNSYTALASNPITSTWAHAAVYLNGKVYWIGGLSATGTGAANVEAYDIAGNTWSAVAPLPTAEGFLMATAIGNFIYAAGGVVSTESSAVYRYDPTTNAWTTMASMPTTRWGAANGVYAGKWVIGGGYSSNAIVNTTVIYDPVTNTWSGGDNMPVSRARFAAGTTSTAIYAIGGRDPSDPSPGFGGHNDNQRYLPVTCSGTPTNTPTRTNSPTITPTITPTFTPFVIATPTCPALIRVVGPGNPGEANLVSKPANSANTFKARGHISGQSAFTKPNIPDTAPIVFQLDDGTIENSVGFGDGTLGSAAIWMNRFTPPSGAYPVTLSNVYIFWPDAAMAAGNLTGRTVRLLVYNDTDGDNNPANATPIYSQSVTINIQPGWQTFPVAVSVPGPTGDIYIGFEDQYNEPGTLPETYPAAIDQTASQVRSWVAGMGSGAPPDLNNLANNDVLGTIDSFGLAGNWMIRASGTSALPSPCGNTLVGHVTYQGIAANTPRNVQPITLTLCVGGTSQNFVTSTDNTGHFTVTLTLTAGPYNYKVKNYKNLSNGGTLTLSAGTTNQEFGTLRAGDSNNNDIIQTNDFTTLKTAFGTSNNLNTDFNNDGITNTTDFTLQHGNFGLNGTGYTCP